MKDISEQILEVEKEIRETPYHKGTEHYIGRLRAKLARLKDKLLDSQLKSSIGGGAGYAVKKHGDATVVLVGPPSSGKSTLINKLTNTNSKVAEYEFTTLEVIPGMMIYKDAYIQIFDVPGLIEGSQKGKGRGKKVLSVTRAADLLLIMTDVRRIDRMNILLKELHDSGIRINKPKPQVRVEKKVEGGIEVKSNIRQDLDQETIKEIAREMGIKNAEITLKEKVSLEDLIDSLSQNRIYLPAFFVINKIDEVQKLPKTDIKDETYFISAEKGMGLSQLREVIWKKLGFVKIFLVKDDQKPNFDSPIIMKEGQTLSEVLPKLGSDFESKYKIAKIWGKIARFPGQEVPLSAKVVEGLQIRFI